MKRFALLIVAACGGLLALAGPAAAHVTVSAPDAKQGGYTVVTFRVPTESASASTTKVVVQMPTATPFASVAVQPTPGWTTSTADTKLTTPIKTDDGDTITSATSQVTWTAGSGAAVKPGQFQQFNLEVGPLPKTSSVTFKAIQTYSDGSVVRWIETPAPGSSAEPEHPAPTLQLAAAGSTSASASAQPRATTRVRTESASNTGPVVLSIVALVLGAAALGVALVARARKGSA